MLEFRGVVIRKGADVLVALDRTVGPGEVLTVMGPSGVGKSTLLSAVTGQLPPDFTLEGEIWLDGTEITHVPPHRRMVGILFQDDLLFPHLSVGANLAFGLRPGGSRAERQARVEAALEDVGLGGFADREDQVLNEFDTDGSSLAENDGDDYSDLDDEFAFLYDDLLIAKYGHVTKFNDACWWQ